jgi:hypothetical protein
MSTTHLASEVVDLKNRLAQLVERREKLGKQWAERISHDRPGCEVLAYELALVERALTEQWPAESKRWVQEWILADANRLHDPGEKREDCSFCAAARRPARAA